MYDEVVDMLIAKKAVKVTKFLSPTQIIRAVRTRNGGKFSRGNIEITLTVGKPNYLEREFIKVCQQAKETFPVRGVQVKFLPKKKSIR